VTQAGQIPPHLTALGLQLFGSKSNFEQVVANSKEIKTKLHGVPLTLRSDGRDSSLKWEELEEGVDSYGLKTLRQLLVPSTIDTGFLDRDGGASDQNLSINMLDIGGNYGIVTIATYKLHPDLMRIVTFEPCPTTYFFLRWNLWLNGVPEMDEQTFVSVRSARGALALHRGVVGEVEKPLEMCYNPQSSKDSRAKEWASNKEDCTNVPTISANHAMSLFGSEAITFIKVDCEGCEVDFLPVFQRHPAAQSVLRVAGELHCAVPYHPDLVGLACTHQKGAYWSQCLCPEGKYIGCGFTLEC
jgi:FkbM family methyltransferase